MEVCAIFKSWLSLSMFEVIFHCVAGTESSRLYLPFSSERSDFQPVGCSHFVGLTTLSQGLRKTTGKHRFYLMVHNSGKIIIIKWQIK